MPNRQDEPTESKGDGTDGKTSPFSRRRILQMTGVGVASGALVTSSAIASNNELPTTIVIDGTVSRGKSNYEFLVSDSVDAHPEMGDPDAINGGHVKGTVHRDKDAYRFNGELSYLDVTGQAEVRLYYGDDDDADSSTQRLEIVSESDATLEYSFVSSDQISKVLDNGDYSANEGEDCIVQNDDDTWTARGSAGNGEGDTYDYGGEITHFKPVTGSFTLFVDGEETTVPELTGQEVSDDGDSDEGEDDTSELAHELKIVSTDETPAMYYGFTVEGEIVAGDDTQDHDEVSEEDGLWRVQGQIDSNDTDTYEVAQKLERWVAIERDGERVDDSRFGLYWDGEEVTVEEILAEEEQEECPRADEANTLTLRSNPDDSTPSMWYRVETDCEIEEGENILSHDESFEEDDGWVAEGQFGPFGHDGWEVWDRDLNYFGAWELDADGSRSTDRPVSPDDFTFEWNGEEIDPEAVADRVDLAEEREEPDEPDGGAVGIRHDAYDGVLGGGDGMSDGLVYSEAEADHVVSSMSELQSAVNGAASGDVIYVSGRISGSLTVSTRNLTIAGNRGIGNDGRWTSATLDQNAPNLRLDGLSIDAGGGTFCNVNSTGLEVFNCLVENSSSGNGAFGWNTGDTGATFSHCTFRDWGYYGLQVRYNWHSENSKITIEYCDMYDLGQHMVQGGQGWFHVRDNHFHGRLNHSVDHVLEVRGAGGAPVSCGTSAGNAIVEHNLNEARGSSGAKSGLVRVRGVPTDGVWVERNRSPGNDASTGGCSSNGSHGGWGEQLVMQNASDTNSFSNVHIEGNER